MPDLPEYSNLNISSTLFPTVLNVQCEVGYYLEGNSIAAFVCKTILVSKSLLSLQIIVTQCFCNDKMNEGAEDTPHDSHCRLLGCQRYYYFVENANLKTAISIAFPCFVNFNRREI